MPGTVLGLENYHNTEEVLVLQEFTDPNGGKRVNINIQLKTT